MTLLLLGGTREARELSKRLSAEGADAVMSLAGVTRAPVLDGLTSRLGGFGGAEGFASYVSEEKITAVLDATHPFASQITDRTAQMCQDLELPYAQLLRPAWVPRRDDNWLMIDAEDDAAAHIPLASTVFLATGRQTLGRFENLKGRRVICRQIDPPDGPFPFDGGEYLIGRPPFSVPDEVALFKDLSVDWLVVKNAGGAASFTKLEAARRLGLSVLMIKRPPMPDAHRIETVDAAMDWVRSL